MSTETKPAVIKKSSVTVSEKQKIEALLDKRVQAVEEHLSNLSNVSTRISEYLPFSKQEQLDVITKEKIEHRIVLDRINNDKKAEVNSTLKVIEDEYKIKRERLNKLMNALDDKHHELVSAANTMIADKYADKETKLVNRIADIDILITALTKEAENEKQLKVFGLSESIHSLRSGLRDRRNAAVEHIWTSSDSADAMKEALNMIPESTNFRNNFSVASFTSNIMAIVSSNAGLLSSSDKCTKCKRGTLRIESSGVYCNHCGHYQVHKKDLIPMAALPTFDQITKNLGVQAESPKPAAEPQTT